ncbi:hypothetical protein M8J77_023652 [Diaphorina citri]|nr:hypothetical protein M8J77_023652 [Diaphorina citri]
MHCIAFIKTVADKEITLKNLDHSHDPPSEDALLRRQLSTCAKRKATENLCELPSKVMKTVISEVQPECQSLTTNDVKLAKRNMYMARRKMLPKLPLDKIETYAIFSGREYSPPYV